eukprot:GHVS01098605.1.p1 GENE.GHVS01098605.1~~GHVS01098605.1.p1  ORF type:complete len:700 (+),score=109.03 GHVS01098605.1:287-2386(+)
MVHLPASKDQFYKTKLCPHHETGGCRKKVDCFFAHGLDELRIAPDLRKTKLCQDFIKNGACSRGNGCMYAHGEKELRFTDGYWKTDLCKYWKSGGCTSGHFCRHAHGQEELRPARKHKQEKVDGKFKGTTPRSRESKQHQEATGPTECLKAGGGSLSVRNCQVNKNGGSDKEAVKPCGGYMSSHADPCWEDHMGVPSRRVEIAPLRSERVEEGHAAEEAVEANRPIAMAKETKQHRVEESRVEADCLNETPPAAVRLHPKIVFLSRDDMEGDDDCFGRAVPMYGNFGTPQPALVPQSFPICISELGSVHASLEDVDVIDDAYIDGDFACLDFTADDGMPTERGRTVIRQIGEMPKGTNGGCPDIRVSNVNGCSSTEVLEFATSSSDYSINQATDVCCSASTPCPFPPPPPADVNCLSHLPLSKRPSLSVPSPSITSFSRKGRSSLRLNFIPPPPKDIPPPPPQQSFGIPPPPPSCTTSPAPSRSSCAKSKSGGSKSSLLKSLPPPPPRLGNSLCTSTICSTVPSRSNSIASSRCAPSHLSPFIPPPPVDHTDNSFQSSMTYSPCCSQISSVTPLAPLSHHLTSLCHNDYGVFPDMAAVAGAAWEEEGRKMREAGQTSVENVAIGSDWGNGSGMVSSSHDGSVYYSYLPVAVDANGTVMYAPMFMWEKVESGVPVDLQAKFHTVQLQDLTTSCEIACYDD